jgi:hypothetical protein
MTNFAAPLQVDGADCIPISLRRSYDQNSYFSVITWSVLSSREVSSSRNVQIDVTKNKKPDEPVKLKDPQCPPDTLNLTKIALQSTSENRTVVGFRIQFYASTWHSISGPFEIRTKMSGFWMASLDRYIKKRVIKIFYSWQNGVG